ncbi:hypothetical protein [Streptococcus chenjunshii]|uniref:hypothetical protein n=1 Tax=Streptococcus chenjunshii TaxID=2173853 RepID=UPI0013C37705|nr:hypothetical protein [Streptococcus chenjunshii]
MSIKGSKEFWELRKQFTDEDWEYLNFAFRDALTRKKERMTKGVELTDEDVQGLIE